jgi:hypothetical protein
LDAAAFNEYETDPNIPFYQFRKFSFPLDIMTLGPAAENGDPDMFALSLPNDQDRYLILD